MIDTSPPGSLLMTIHRLSQGGADRVAILLANGFAARGISTEVLVLRDGGEAERTLCGMLHDTVCLTSAGRPMGSYHLELARGLGTILKRIAASKPTIVLASSSNMGLVTGICARLHHRRRNRPHFFMKLTNPVFRSVDAGPVRRLFRRLLYNFIFGSYDRILVLTKEQRDALINVYPQYQDRFVTVANPYIGPEALAPYHREEHRQEAQVLAIGRLMPQKRFDRLLRAFALVADHQARLTILGDGPLRPDLVQLSIQLGIDGRIEMPGFVECVVPYLHSADLLVISSDYEGLPAVALEALTCDVPVVTTNCFEGARSLLEALPRCSVVDRCDVPALAAAIDKSLSQRHVAVQLHAHARPYGFEAAIAAHVAEITSDMPRDCLDVAPDSGGNGVPLGQGAQSRRPGQLEVRVDQGSDARGTDVLNDSTPVRGGEQTARCGETIG